jgi:hypothetical protein
MTGLSLNRKDAKNAKIDREEKGNHLRLLCVLCVFAVQKPTGGGIGG